MTRRKEVEFYNTVIGTQIFAPKYHFGEEGALVGAAREMLRLGSSCIKFDLNPWGYPELKGFTGDSVAVLDTEPYRKVFELPFSTYVLWWHPENIYDRSENRVEKAYREVFRLAELLLKRYSGSGKCFLIGNWEGDWLALRKDLRHNRDADPAVLDGLKVYFSAMQRAVEDARNTFAHRDVKVAHYVEVNLPLDAKDHGFHRLTNALLPELRVDAVSYSCYDSLQLHRLTEALDYIEQNAVFTDYLDDIFRKKVWIGEFDAYCGDYNQIRAGIGRREQRSNVREAVVAAVSWGCPYVFFWEMYNNEECGVYKLVDESGRRTAAYAELQRGIRILRRIGERFRARAKRPIRTGEYAAFALLFNMRTAAERREGFDQIFEALREAGVLGEV